MSTAKQKAAAKKNIKKAQKASAKSKGSAAKSKASGLSTKEKNRLKDSTFAFSDERKEPLSDAKHVRNAISRFDQVEGVSDKERDRAWKRILKAAKKFDVEVSESSWRDLGDRAKAKSKS
jgi:hypothetical protein